MTVPKHKLEEMNTEDIHLLDSYVGCGSGAKGDNKSRSTAIRESEMLKDHTDGVLIILYVKFATRLVIEYF